MEKEHTQLKVGIFVFVALSLAMYVIFMLGGEHQLFRSQYTLMTEFEDISGLRVGAPVQLSGLKVGYVDRISFPSDLTKKDIELTLKINKKFRDRIRKDSVATINTQGLLGDKFIYINIGSEGEPVLGDGELMASKETANIFDVVKKSGEIVEDISIASRSARKFFEDMYTSKEDVREVLHSMKDIMDGIESGNGLLHAMIYDPTGKEVIKNLASSLDSFSGIVSRADEADKKSGEVSGVLQNMRAVSRDLKDITARVERGEGTIGGLLNDPALYNDLRELFGRANRNRLFKAIVRSTLVENDKLER